MLFTDPSWVLLSVHNILCLLFLVILAYFDHDNPLLKIIKIIIFSLGSKLSRLGPYLLEDKDLHYLVQDWIFKNNVINPIIEQ